MAIFKNSSGALYTKQLFFETADTEREYVLYTLKDEDHQGYPSIRRLYVEMGDQTEYVFATTYFASWRHFKRLLDSPWFLPVIEEAREELALRLSAQNLLQIRMKAEAGDLKANQYLLEGKWQTQDKKVGRPTKEAIKQQAEELFLQKEDIFSDLQRIRPQ